MSAHAIDIIGPIIILASILMIQIIIVSPEGDFPLQDDWAYARVVNGLYTDGQLRLSPWIEARLVFQAYWGLLLSHIFGFSHTALRISTLILSGVGVFAFYLLLCELLDSWRSLVVTLLMLLNPMYVNLSYSFMTDVPFISLSLMALACNVRAMRTGNPAIGWLVGGSIFAGCAFLVRQLGIALPLAALGGLVLTTGWRAALRPTHLVVIVGPFALALIISAYVDAQRGEAEIEPIASTIEYWGGPGSESLRTLIQRITGMILFLGFFTLPVTGSVLTARDTLGLRSGGGS